MKHVNNRALAFQACINRFGVHCASVIALVAVMVGCKPQSEPAPGWRVTESVWVDAPQWQVTPLDDSPYSMTVFAAKQVPGCRMSSDDVVSVISASGECLNTGKVGANINLYLYVQQPTDEARTFRLNYYSTSNKCYYVTKDTYTFVNDSQLGTVDNMLAPEWQDCGQYPYLEEMKIMILGKEAFDQEDELAVFSGNVCRTTGPVTVISNDAEALQLSMLVPMERVKESFDVHYYDSRTKTVYTATGVEIGYRHSGIGTAIFTGK